MTKNLKKYPALTHTNVAGGTQQAGSLGRFIPNLLSKFREARDERPCLFCPTISGEKLNKIDTSFIFPAILNNSGGTRCPASSST